MPKRKKSHDYCRVRFGIFKRRRVSAANTSAQRCDDDCCVVRFRRQLVKSSEVSQHDSTISMASVSTGHYIPRPPVYFQHVNQGPSSLDCLWSSGDYSNSENSSPHSISTLTMMDRGSSVINDNDTSIVQLPPVQKFSISPTTESDDRFQKVMNLVALTSSLKLSENNGHSNCTASDFESHTCIKEHMDLTALNPSTTDNSILSTPVMSELACNFWNYSSVVAAPKCSCVGMTVDFNSKETYSIYTSRSQVCSHNLQPEHRLYPSPIVNEPPNPSSDSDEGFCEPNSKRAYKFSSGKDGIAQLDEGVNTADKIVPDQTLQKRSKYTNHLGNSSICCSLYWQMMSNQYGIPTQIHSTEKNYTTHPFESHSSPIPGVEIKSAPPSMRSLRFTQKPLMITSDEDKARESKEESVCQKQQSGIFAVGKLVPGLTNVEGTLGLSLQHAINCNKSVFVFDCQVSQSGEDNGTCEWYQYCKEKSTFVPCYGVPVLKQNFAGLCTHELPKAGRLAIKTLFHSTFGAP